MKKNIQTIAAFSKMQSIPASLDARAPQADITNAPELFGDPMNDDFGDADFGDADDFGDSEDGDVDSGDVDYGDVDYGDPDVLSMYSAISGDPKPNKRKVKQMVAGGAIGAAAGFGIARLGRLINRKRKARKALMKQRANTVARANTLRRSVPHTGRYTYMNHLNISGAVLNTAPIPPTSKFVVDTLKLLLDQQQVDGLPFYSDIIAGTAIPGGFNLASTFAGPQDRRYCAFVIKLGSASLTASPGTIITVTGTIPTSGGILTLTQPIIFTYKAGFYVNLLIFPWNLVTTKTFINGGLYGATAGQFNLNVTGVPANSTCSLVIPGSLDEWTITLRNSIANK